MKTLEHAIKQLKEIRKIKVEKVFKNNDLEIERLENQLIGEIQILRQLKNGNNIC